jgi:hypothetical protein
MNDTRPNPTDDPEQAAAQALLRCCGDWLALQPAVQPDKFPAIAEGLHGATELRFEVTMLVGGDRSANVRIVALDGEGSQIMLIRSLVMAPPAR